VCEKEGVALQPPQLLAVTTPANRGGLSFSEREHEKESGRGSGRERERGKEGGEGERAIEGGLVLPPSFLQSPLLPLGKRSLVLASLRETERDPYRLRETERHSEGLRETCGDPKTLKETKKPQRDSNRLRETRRDS
jgi:hypothetical protein